MGQCFYTGSSWAIRFDLPGSKYTKRKRKQIAGFPDEKTATEYLKKAEAEITLGLMKLPSEITVSDVLDKWYYEYVVDNLAPSTVAFYDNYINVHIKPNIGDSIVDTLKVNNITKFYSLLHKNGASDNTIDKTHRTLRTAFYHCYREEFINNKLMDRIKVTKYEPPALDETENYWDVESIKKVEPFLKTLSIYFNVMTALYLGLRAEETAAIHIDDIDFKKGVIKIRHAVKKVYGSKDGFIKGKYIRRLDANTVLKVTKNKKIKTLPLTEEMIYFFKKHIKEIANNKLYFKEHYDHTYDGFLSIKETGELNSDRSASSIWSSHIKGIADQAGVPVITFHGLRHSCASWLVYNNVPMKIIQEVLGHNELKMTTDVYSHISIEQKMAALNTLKHS